MTIPDKPGLYYNVSFETYLAIPALNNTTLGWLEPEKNRRLGSPAYCAYRMTSEPDDTPSLRLGDAAHVATLEPERFARQYESDLEYIQKLLRTRKDLTKPRSTTDYKQHVAARKKAGTHVLKSEEHAAALTIALQFGSNPDTAGILELDKRVEVVAIWERDGVLCKARFDALGFDWIADIKTTRDLYGFSPWIIDEYKLERQAAWYLEGARANGLEIATYYWPVVSNKPPHETGLFYLDEQTFRAGQKKVNELFALYAQCHRTGKWPGHFDGRGAIAGMMSEKRLNEIFDEGV